MIAILRLDELRKLYQTGYLNRSDNTNYLDETTMEFLEEIFREQKSDSVAKILYLKEPIDVQSLKTDIEQDHPIKDMLPMFEGDQLFIVTKDDDVLPVSSSVLDELESSSVALLRDIDYFREVVLENNSESSKCIYAFSSKLRINDVTEVIYPASLSSAVEKLKANKKARDTVFTPTKFF